MGVTDELRPPPPPPAHAASVTADTLIKTTASRERCVRPLDLSLRAIIMGVSSPQAQSLSCTVSGNIKFTRNMKIGQTLQSVGHENSTRSWEK
jgi:hypothetical protein